MRFLYPSLFLVWAPLVLVPIVLYLFRPRPRTVRTSTLPFFKWLAREHQDSAWLRWLKHLLSLLLSILVVLGAAAALARLVVAPSAESLRTVVVLVDRSASMAAGPEEGRTRLQEAVSLVEHRLAGLSAGVGVIVMAYDRRPEVLLSRSLDRRQVRRALASIRVRPIEGKPAEAIELARRLAALETPASIWHATDATDEARTSNSQSSTDGDEGAAIGGEESHVRDSSAAVVVEHLGVAMPRPRNVGITAFRLRRRPMERGTFEAFVQVHCVADEPVPATLDIAVDGTLVAPRKLTLRPGGRERLLIPVEAAADADRVLSLQLSVEGDVLPLDDVVHARVPRLRPVQVLWISESPDPFTELALSSLGIEGDLEVLQGPPSAWPPKDAVDVVVFDHWAPPEWPTDVPVIGVDPPGPLGPVRAVRIGSGGLPLENLRAPSRDHPVLYGVATGRVAVTQTAVVEAGGPLESLWIGPQGPLLLAGEIRGQRIVVMAFSPQHSEQLPLMASYPLLIGNAIYWAAAHELESAQGMNRRTGELVKLEGKHLIWQDSRGRDAAEGTVALQGGAAELDRIGPWRTDAGQSGSASLLSVRDTLIPARPQDASAGDDEQAESPLQGDLAPLLLWGVLALLVVESWLYHRYVAY
ncbi:MAG: BatA and WFA domain-containing protein [Pirellulales bacterium]|nr:BatA and WFA domain-containing protein [Pirellulales bacterium]